MRALADALGLSEDERRMAAALMMDLPSEGARTSVPRVVPPPLDPLVSALDQALQAGADRRLAEAMLNALREQVGLPAIGQRSAHSRARAR
jgi:hypothetical protein